MVCQFNLLTIKPRDKAENCDTKWILRLMWLPVKKKENSEFKPVKLFLRIDLM